MFSDDYEEQLHEEAFGRGLEEGRNGSSWDDLCHDLGDAIRTMVPETTEHQSYEHGYEEGARQRTGWDW